MDAVRLIAGLGTSGARFDRFRVDAAVRSRLGRIRLRIALRRPFRSTAARPAYATARESRPRARLRGVRGRPVPARPSGPSRPGGIA